MNEPESIAQALERYAWYDGRHHIPDTQAITISTAAVLAHTTGPIGPESENSPQVQNALQAIFDTALELPAGMTEEWPGLESFLELPLHVRVDEINKRMNPHQATLWAQRADILIALRAQAF